MFYLHLAPCEEDEFQCPPDGPCYPIMYLCDSVIDCFDGFDENCPSSENISAQFNVHVQCLCVYCACIQFMHQQI